MKIRQSEYFRHILTLFGGSASAQLILLAGTPVLTRLYSPSEFGIFALFLAFSSIIGLVASGRYEIAVLLPARDTEAIGIFRFSLMLALLSSSVAFIVVVTIGLLAGFESQDLGIFLLLVPLGILFQAILQCFVNLSNRVKRYGMISRSRLSGSIVVVMGSIVLGVAGMGAGGLIIGKLAGQLVEVFIFQWGLRHLKVTTGDAFTFKAIFNKYLNFLKFSTLEALLNRFSRELPVFALSWFFSQYSTGLYSLAQKAIGNPLNMISSAVGSVFFQKAAQYNFENEDSLRAFFLKNLYFLLLIAAPLFVIGIIFSPFLFAFIFGPEWREAGVYAAWLMPFVCITFLKAPLSSVIDIKNKMRENVGFELTFLLFSVVSFGIGIELDDALLGVMVFSLSNSLLGLLQLWWFYRLTLAEKSTY